MIQLRFVPFVIFIYLLTFQRFIVECRPRVQRIVIHGHEWTVPNEPGWEDGKIVFEIFIYKDKNDFCISCSKS